MMYIYLDIVKEFSCRQCGRCCQNDWLVTVDEDGYRRNRDLFAAMGRNNEFEQAFIPLGEAADYGEYAKIAKRPGKGCWFLTGHHLCRLQQMAGHEHLDSVCQWFPRYPMDTERGIELSLSFSCPEALRLAQREEPLRVVRSEVSPLPVTPGDFVTYVYPSQQHENHALRYYFELEGHLIDILQSRTVFLQDRLMMARRLLENLAIASANERVTEKIGRLFQADYERIDAAGSRNLAEENAKFWLAENFFVNFFFRKNIYRHGFEETARQLDGIQEQLRPFLRDKKMAGDELPAMIETMVQLETEYNHKSGKDNKLK